MDRAGDDALESGAARLRAAPTDGVTANLAGNLSGHGTEGAVRKVSALWGGAHSGGRLFMTGGPMSESAILETPLHALHVELGARMAPFAGYDMPIQYPGGVLAEHLHTRSQGGTVRRLAYGAGASRGRRLREPCGASRNPVPRGLRQSRARPAALHAVAQRQRGHRRRPDGGACRPAPAGELRLVVNAARKAVDFALIRERLPKGVRLTPLGETALIALQGPLAAATLARLAPDEGLEAAPFMSVRPARIAGVETFVSRSGYTGEDGFEISLPAARGRAFARLLLAEPGVAPIGLGARDSLRLEAGLCLYGHELDETAIPSKRGSAGRSRSAAASRAAFPAPSAFGARWLKGRRAGASACGPRDGRRRAKARRSYRRRRADRRRHLRRLWPERRRADRDGLCRRAYAARRNARRSRRARQDADVRASSHCRFHPHAYYRG